MPKAFVIHIHSGFGPTHHDLMFEDGAALATWRLADDPAGLAPGASMPAVKLPDHRRAYLSYEGPVSRGRGLVRRLDAGTFELLSASDDHWDVHIQGRRLGGHFVLRRLDSGPDQWRLERVEQARPE